jgi:hypothetical protein
LQSILVTHLIEGVVDLVQDLKKLLAFVRLNNAVELMDVDEYDRYLSLVVTEVLLATSDLVSDQARHQDVEDLLELLETPDLLVATDERRLLLQLLHVDVYTPDDTHEDP